MTEIQGVGKGRCEGSQRKEGMEMMVCKLMTLPSVVFMISTMFFLKSEQQVGTLTYHDEGALAKRTDCVVKASARPLAYSCSILTGAQI